MMIPVKIEIENITEFKKLLTTAREQLKQLENTISQLNEFELKIKSQVDEKHIR
ncbi:hypothetical protein [Limosilactobacillus fastidiosus]|uniref:Uncharacterized protein n=1 Tax=Limosilactobacillus fastidiosus TaxID=2759855 RepID=A0A7W3YCV8_9LACO|nr:hypothetical protein [Limosilactobacillus fastidiosus]MBB1086402.1 hypothetical protein [Limosilactobacillus fastidiosus]MCD7086223.1 hypothetical protein [Limosilactobacillus fastidiosus]MCD7114986.1 hypothetical protein [Limosilactobacillus fastidiosus]MCD7116851.1 hypothetical protein [Limosilactobacillus fastidiosus]